MKAYNFLKESISTPLYKKDNTKVYSPILVENDRILFYLDKVVYEVKNSIVKPIREKDVPLSFTVLTNVSDSFKFSENSMEFFGKARILINLDEHDSVMINDYLLVEGEIRDYLLKIGLYSYGDPEITLIENAFKNVRQFVMLDFVTTAIHENTKINFMRFKNNIYFNEINLVTFTNRFEKINNASNFVNEMKDLVNYDFSNQVIDLLEGEELAKAQLQKIEDNLIDKLAFLKEQRSKLAEEDKSIIFIKEADKLLVDEITKIEEEIRKTRSDGFVPGRLNDDFGDYKEGTNFRLEAIDYTSKGNDDLIDCYLTDDTPILIPKSLIKLDAIETI